MYWSVELDRAQERGRELRSEAFRERRAREAGAQRSTRLRRRLAETLSRLAAFVAGLAQTLAPASDA